MHTFLCLRYTDCPANHGKCGNELQFRQNSTINSMLGRAERKQAQEALNLMSYGWQRMCNIKGASVANVHRRLPLSHYVKRLIVKRFLYIIKYLKKQLFLKKLFPCMWEQIFWNFEKGNICRDLQKKYLRKILAFVFRSCLAYCPLFTGYPVYTHLVTFFQVSAQKAEPGVWKGCGEMSLGVPTRVSSPRTVECRVVSVTRVSHDTTLLSVTPLLGPVVVPLGHHICIHMQGTGTSDTRLAFD